MSVTHWISRFIIGTTKWRWHLRYRYHIDRRWCLKCTNFVRWKFRSTYYRRIWWYKFNIDINNGLYHLHIWPPLAHTVDAIKLQFAKSRYRRYTHFFFVFFFANTNCISSFKNVAPSGCLQYHYGSSGIIRSFNYSPSPNARANSIGVDGTRQIAGLSYGICIQAASSCSITYSVLSSDIYSFTVTGDVGAVDPVLLGTGTLQEQLCNTDYIIIPYPSQGGTLLTSGSDRFCGLGLNPTTSRRNTIQIPCIFNFII